MSVACHSLPGCLLAQPIVQFGEARSAAHVLFGYAMNVDVVGIKVVVRVNKPHFGANFSAVLKGDDADLADAAHARICGFEINGNEAHGLQPYKPNVLLQHPVHASGDRKNGEVLRKSHKKKFQCGGHHRSSGSKISGYWQAITNARGAKSSVYPRREKADHYDWQSEPRPKKEPAGNCRTDPKRNDRDYQESP
jgi:hypothetical protein